LAILSPSVTCVLFFIHRGADKRRDLNCYREMERGEEREGKRKLKFERRL